VILYELETWSLALREDYRLRVFENRALRRIFGPKRDELTAGRRNLHNEENYNFIIRMIKLRRIGWAGNVARIWDKMNTCRIWVEKSEGKRPLGILKGIIQR
jgi:hypothetical protein